MLKIHALLHQDWNFGILVYLILLLHPIYGCFGFQVTVSYAI